ncbi:hypothetical protein [Methylosinus sp. PW1]|uniref:hypothetical protein n=1 Tax=Methylosinus sp. PW1 TaxID=107636 RepID=UPI000AF8C287|nr:hypothetical protein [Methylosinus sp. PW1]
MSDLHIEHGPRWAPPDLPEHDVVVLAGDIHAPPAEAVRWASAAFTGPVVYVAGNHEFYSRNIDGGSIPMAELVAQGVPVHLLDRRSVVIDGVRFVGAMLWTDYNLYGDPAAAMAEAARYLNDHRLIHVATASSRRRMRCNVIERISHIFARSFCSRSTARPSSSRTMRRIPDRSRHNLSMTR